MLSPFFRLVLATMGSASVLAVPVRPNPDVSADVPDSADDDKAKAGVWRTFEEDRWKPLKNRFNEVADLLQGVGFPVAKRPGKVKQILTLLHKNLKILLLKGNKIGSDYGAPQACLSLVLKCLGYVDALLNSDEYKIDLPTLNSKPTETSYGTWKAGLLEEYRQKLRRLHVRLWYDDVAGGESVAKEKIDRYSDMYCREQFV